MQPSTPPISSPAQHSGRSVERSMLLVLLALLPGLLVATWFFGYGLLINIVLAAALSCLVEALVFTLRGQPWQRGLSDLSVLVTAMLLALALPPGISAILLAQGVLIAVVVGKHAFGGLGQNPFNPAMVGYVFLLLSYPAELTAWLLPIEESRLSFGGLQQSLQAAFSWPFGESRQLVADGMAAATPLLEYKLAAPNALSAAYADGVSIWQRSSGTAWELLNIAYLLGGLMLLFTGVIRWQIPCAILGGVSLLALLFFSDSSAAVVGTPYFHLFNGATMLCAFFIATDPSSSAISGSGRLAYGLIIAAALYAVRVWGSYLDAVAIAVLLGNFLAPLCDRLLAPRRFGQKSSDPRHQQGAGQA